MEPQVVDLQRVAGARKGGADSICPVGKNSVLLLRHCFDDPQSLWRELDPYVIPLFLPGMFHIADEHAPMSFVEIRPGNARNLLLPASREYRERDDFVHRCRLWRPCLPIDKELHEEVQLGQCRAPVSLVRLRSRSKIAQYDLSVAHCGLVQLHPPRRLGDTEDRGQVRYIVADRLWLATAAQELLCERHYIAASNGAAIHISNSEILDGLQHLSLRTPDLALFVVISIDGVGQSRRLRSDLVQPAGAVELRLTKADPRLGFPLSIESLGFAPNYCPAFLSQNLRCIRGAAVFALAGVDGSHPVRLSDL